MSLHPFAGQSLSIESEETARPVRSTEQGGSTSVADVPKKLILAWAVQGGRVTAHVE